MPRNPSISVSAVVLQNANDDVALVRKNGTRFFIFPGGKPEPGESGFDAAVREVREELGVVLQPGYLHHLGDYTTPAANEANTQLHSTVYRARLPQGQAVAAQAEIAELIWASPGTRRLPGGQQLAPLSGKILHLLGC